MEFKKRLKSIPLWASVLALVYLFIVHETGIVSRLQYGSTAVLFVVISWSVRTFNKRNITKQTGYSQI